MTRHLTVYRERGIYAGWPANHGHWQWGDEFLVGFLRGPYLRRQIGGHNISRPFEKVLARSMDGGETWNVEVPNVDFEAQVLGAAPSFDLGASIMRVCGVYDHGGEECDPRGGFYLSSDRGKTWQGAFSFDGLEKVLDGREMQCTSRTCVSPSGLIFLSAAERHRWGTDFVFCARNDGNQFEPHGILPRDGNRTVMPAVVEVGDTLVAVARRSGVGYWIEAYRSQDGGSTWEALSRVGGTGRFNGNPPALAEVGGRLFCAYGERADEASAIVVSVSDDMGETWTPHTLRFGFNPDIGYPRLFKRADGQLVCVYYWAVTPDDEQHIAATVFHP